MALFVSSAIANMKPLLGGWLHHEARLALLATNGEHLLAITAARATIARLCQVPLSVMQLTSNPSQSYK